MSSSNTGIGKISLSLTKPGEDLSGHKRIALNLKKPAKFTAELYWDSPDDLDAHAILGVNTGDGAKITDLSRILSTFNCKRTNPSGVLTGNPNGSFSTPEGALSHSGDCTDGLLEDVDEVITINGAMMPPDVNEIPIFCTIYPSGVTKFAQVKQAGVRIKDDRGTVLGEYNLTNEFGEFDAVQMGTLVLENDEWHYVPAGAGISGDFNDILGYFC